jgi:hypothetical protein
MGRRIAVAFAISAVTAAAAAVGFFVGRANPRSQTSAIWAARHDAFGRGYLAGASQAATRAQNAYSQGRTDGDHAGYGRGYSAGLKRFDGIIRKTVSDSFDARYKAVFDGFGSAWQTGAYYIVKIDPGTGGVPYEISSRMQMDPADYYDLCPSSGDICGGPWSNITSLSGGSTSVPDSGSLSPPDTSSGGSLGALEPTYPIICTDGWISPSGGHQGACSHHGGEL